MRNSEGAKRLLEMREGIILRIMSGNFVSLEIRR